MKWIIIGLIAFGLVGGLLSSLFFATIGPIPN